MNRVTRKLVVLPGVMPFFLAAVAQAAETVKQPATLGMGQADLTDNLLQTTLGLVVIFALIAGAAWLAKRFGNFKVGAQGRMKIVGGLSLGARERVVLLQVGEQQLVLGVAPGRIQTLHVLDEPVPADEPMAHNNRFTGKGFAEKLSAAMNLARSGRTAVAEHNK